MKNPKKKPHKLMSGEELLNKIATGNHKPKKDPNDIWNRILKNK